VTRGCRRRRRRRSCGACDGGGKVMPLGRSTTTTAREATERVMALHLCMPLPVSSFPGWVPAQLLTYHRAAAAGWKPACGHGISMLGPPHIGVYSLLLQPNRLLICTSKQSTGLDLRCVHGEKNGVERSLESRCPPSLAAGAAALLLKRPHLSGFYCVGRCRRRHRLLTRPRRCPIHKLFPSTADRYKQQAP